MIGLNGDFQINKKNQFASENFIDAVSIVTSEKFGNEMGTQNFILADEFSTRVVEDFKEKVLLKSSIEIFAKFCLYSADKISDLGTAHKRGNNIFFIQNFQQFLKIFAKMDNKTFLLDGLFVIILVHKEIPEIKQIFKLLWKIQVFNVNVVFEAGNGEILVKTFMPFNEKSCNDTTPVVINKYSNGKFNDEDFFPNKMKNLHNCSIRIAVTSYSEPYVFANKTPTGYKLFGQDINLIKALSQSMNFYANFNYVENVGFLFENGTAAGSFDLLKRSEVDLVISGWLLKAYRMRFFDASTSYNSDELIFVIPPSVSLGSVEKLIYPFSVNLWTAVIICFILGVLVIFLIRIQPKIVQKFVFGLDINHPYLNLFSIFIGNQQKNVPRRNFARFLLTMFLIYSLIIRTLYQGSFFLLMNSNQNHKEVQSITEMVEENYVFFINHGMKDMIEGISEVWKRLN